MTPANVWALSVGGVVVAGGLAGAVYWTTHQVALSPAAPKPPVAAREAAPPPPPATPKAAPKVADLGASRPSKPVPPPEPPAGHGEPPHFDVVRVEPSGDAVLAGKGDPNADVALLDSGKVVAKTKSDADGNFVILPPTLKPGSYDLSLRQSESGRAAKDSKQNVAVSVPAKPGGQVVVALAEPGKPTKLLTAPPAAQAEPAGPSSAVAPSAVPQLAIRSAEIENGTGFYATGTAAAGTRVEVYLNGSHLAQVVAGRDGQWSVKVRRGLTGGHYSVRADAIGGDGKVVARAEVPFDVPLDVAEAAKPAAKAAEPPKPPQPAREPRPTVAAAVAPPQAVQPPAEPIAPATPPAPVAEVPAPQPEVAAAAKAAVAAAPAIAPPTLAVAPPIAPAARHVPPPEHMAVAPASATKVGPTSAEAKPSVAPSVQAPPSTPADTASANAVIDTVETALVVPGDNLWNISRVRLGEGFRYTRIYAANVSQIRNPSLIYPGQVFVVPSN